MSKLHELARLIRSKNAGPFELTIDIMFEREDAYKRVLESHRISQALFEDLYHVPAAVVDIVPYDPALAIKVTLPRPYAAGGVDDVDILAGQQYAPLVDLDIP
jgi:hypothetical protein